MRRFINILQGTILVLVSLPVAAAPTADEMWQQIQELKMENQALKERIEVTEQAVSEPAPQKNSGTQIITKKRDESGLQFGFGGFIRADSGFGDRYGDAHENDRIGISKAAFAILPKYENIEGVFVIGTELTSLNDSNEDGDIDIKDAFIVVRDFGFEGVDISAGAQPLLFGLKPNGYPGDRSLVATVEYGADGAFAVSNQAGAALVVNWAFRDDMSVKVGVFDQKDYMDSGSVAAADATDGSDFVGNYFVQWRGDNLLESGLYAAAGFERRYVGDLINDNRSIWFAGLGWKNQKYDVSVEYISLDQAFGGTAKDDAYIVAESTAILTDNWSLYADFGRADELDLKTYRLGSLYHYNEHLAVGLEYARDEFGTQNIDSMDVRVSFNY